MMTCPWRLSFRPSRGSPVPGCVGSSRSRAHRRRIACNMNVVYLFSHIARIGPFDARDGAMND